MLRKTFLMSILFFGLSTSSFASFYYLGVGVGPDIAKFAEDATIKQAQHGRVNFNVKNKEELSGKGLFGSLFGGYAMQMPIYSTIMLYLAGELNANLSSLEHDNSNYEFVHKNLSDTQFQITRSFGASIIPGIFIAHNAMFYGRLGYSYGHFNISSTDSSIDDANKNINGFRWGLGLEQVIAKRVALRLEYSEISYTRSHMFTIDKLSNTSKYTSFKPITSEIEFAIIFTSCDFLR